MSVIKFYFRRFLRRCHDQVGTATIINRDVEGSIPPIVWMQNGQSQLCFSFSDLLPANTKIYRREAQWKMVICETSSFTLIKE